MCEFEKLEAFSLKQHEDWKDSYSNVHVLYKTRELSSRSVSKDDGRKVTRWSHSHVRWLYLYLLLAECEVRTAVYGPSFFPFFYCPSAKRAGHENKEGKNEDP